MNSNLIQKLVFLIFIWVLKPIVNLSLSLIYYGTYLSIIACDFTLSIFVTECESKRGTIFQRLRKSINKLRPYPGVYAQATDIILEQGYHFELHKITTEDGYILTAWRLYKYVNHKYPCPIILQHGLLDSSWSWFMNNTKQQTLPYILAEQGYDVWCTNNRGNKYSMAHKTFRNVGYNKKFWNYTFDDLAQYDFKALVMYVKELTARDKVIYIGHSQGTTQAFGYLSNDVDFQKNLQCFVGLGPAMFISNIKSNFLLGAIHGYFFEIIDYIGIPYFFVFDDALNTKIGALCDMIPFIFRNMWFSVTNLICGYPDQNKIDLNKFGFMVAHEPGGCSTKNIIQWMQFNRSKQLSYFDYGKRDNMIKYGQAKPPNYPVENLKKLTIPKYFYVGTKDVVADSVDVQRMLSIMDHATLKTVFLQDYAHLDYVWSVDAYQKLYPQLLEDIKINQK